ncbi:uncharacterized protein EV422DRAFT_581625 [Fimicolochytrium jonesii]|uniref:uncharacterized protein n=1 Tax=Fimicolochytrium jonesii TaxID=1396493 RepID=UPI0022FF2296|nr:uncharacterized protein EV422DRAFT_581625 [Fimicolochytrium jonesii]KAI8816130.1 hypothetical protein EV422DRAFT_581625 [Fimicolochytrium jonesii]
MQITAFLTSVFVGAAAASPLSCESTWEIHQDSTLKDLADLKTHPVWGKTFNSYCSCANAVAAVSTPKAPWFVWNTSTKKCFPKGLTPFNQEGVQRLVIPPMTYDEARNITDLSGRFEPSTPLQIPDGHRISSGDPENLVNTIGPNMHNPPVNGGVSYVNEFTRNDRIKKVKKHLKLKSVWALWGRGKPQKQQHCFPKAPSQTHPPQPNYVNCLLSFGLRRNYSCQASCNAPHHTPGSLFPSTVTLATLHFYGFVFCATGIAAATTCPDASKNPKLPQYLQEHLSPIQRRQVDPLIKYEDDASSSMTKQTVYATAIMLSTGQDLEKLDSHSYGELSVERRLSSMLVRFFPLDYDEYSEYSNVDLPLPRTTAIECTLPQPDYIAAVVPNMSFPPTKALALPMFPLEASVQGLPQLACVAKPALDLYRIMGLPEHRWHMFGAIVGYPTDAVQRRQELLKQQIPDVPLAAAENDAYLEFEEDNEDDDDNTGFLV